MARTPVHQRFEFDGFENPTTTPVPDVVFDRFLSQLGEAELKVLLYIIRRTFGFKRDSDHISFNQFLRGIVTRDGRVLDEGSGIRNRTTLSTALKSLEEKGIIKSEKAVDDRGENVSTVYCLKFKTSSDVGVVRQTYYRSTNSVPPVVRQTYPQQTGFQETGGQQTVPISKDKTSKTGKGSVRGKPQRVSKSHQSPTETDWPPLPEPLVSASSSSNSASPSEEPKRIGELLSQHLRKEQRSATTEDPSKRRRRQTSSETPLLDSVMTELSRYFHDVEHIPSNLTRARNLRERTGLSEKEFIAKLYEAKSITNEVGGNKARAKKSDYLRNKAPYFFSVVTDLLGLKDQNSATRQPTVYAQTIRRTPAKLKKKSSVSS